MKKIKNVFLCIALAIISVVALASCSNKASNRVTIKYHSDLTGNDEVLKGELYVSCSQYTLEEDNYHTYLILGDDGYYYQGRYSLSTMNIKQLGTWSKKDKDLILIGDEVYLVTEKYLVALNYLNQISRVEWKKCKGVSNGE